MSELPAGSTFQSEMEDWLRPISMYGALAKEFMMDPRAFHRKHRVNGIGFGNGAPKENVGAETAGRPHGDPFHSEDYDSDGVDVADLEHVLLNLDLYLTGQSPILSSESFPTFVEKNSTTFTSSIPFFPGSDEDYLNEEAGPSGTKNVTEHFDTHMVDESPILHADDNLPRKGKNIITDSTHQSSSSGIGKDLNELDNNSVEGAGERAPDIRIEEVDMIDELPIPCVRGLPSSAIGNELHDNNVEGPGDGAPMIQELPIPCAGGLPSSAVGNELQDDIIELYNNNIDGVRAPDIRIEKVDVINELPIPCAGGLPSSAIGKELQDDDVEGPGDGAPDIRIEEVDIIHELPIPCAGGLPTSAIGNELQEDIIELYNNNIEGVRAPDIRIEKVDVINELPIPCTEDISPAREENITRDCNVCQLSQQTPPSDSQSHIETEPAPNVNWQSSFSGKRKFLWTAEEEKKLEEGVKKFDKTRGKGKTIPWKLILQFGAGTFHPRRSTENLKDKWRKMCKQRMDS